MEKDDALKRTDHYRCRRCGQLSPLTDAICSNPGCRAQLGIYGETVQFSEQETPPEQKAEAPEITPQPPLAPPVSETESPRPPERQKKQKAPKAAVAAAGKPFMKKKTLLIWLNVIFLLLFGAVTYLSEYATPDSADVGDMIFCLMFLAPVTVLNLLLLWKEKYLLFVFHGLLCLIASFLVFVSIGVLIYPPDYTAPLCLAMMLAFLWLGVISFLKPSRKKLSADGTLKPFMSKKAVLICLDILALLFFCAGTVYQVELLFSQADAGAGAEWKTAALLLTVGVQAVFTAVAIVFAAKQKYVIHGILYCLCGVANFFFQWSNVTLLLVLSVTVTLFYVWLGIVSFFRGE